MSPSSVRLPPFLPLFLAPTSPAPRSPPGSPPAPFPLRGKDGVRGGPAKDSANLARIRDNQRRSRARRKEYVQDLEARLRRVELQGVEAATEIQAAARRVADENRRLRALLARHGVADDAIDAWLAASAPPGDHHHDGRRAGDAAAVGKAVGRLEQVLVPRRPSCGSLALPVRPGSRETSVSDSGRNTGWDAMAGHSPGGLSPLPTSARQVAGPMPSPSATSGMHHVGIYTLEGPAAGDHSSYGIDYDAAISMPYVQLSSPPEYSSIPVDYFGRARYSQGQYPC